MDRLTLWIFIGAVIAILFLLVVLFIHILRMARKAKLQTKIAVMDNSANTPETELVGARKTSIKPGVQA